MKNIIVSIAISILVLSTATDPAFATISHYVNQLAEECIADYENSKPQETRTRCFDYGGSISCESETSSRGFDPSLFYVSRDCHLKAYETARSSMYEAYDIGHDLISDAFFKAIERPLGEQVKWYDPEAGVEGFVQLVEQFKDGKKRCYGVKVHSQFDNIYAERFIKHCSF